MAARGWGGFRRTDRSPAGGAATGGGEHSVKEIAAILNISSKTVAFHKANVMRRSGIRSTAE